MTLSNFPSNIPCMLYIFSVPVSSWNDLTYDKLRAPLKSVLHNACLKLPAKKATYKQNFRELPPYLLKLLSSNCCWFYKSKVTLTCYN